MNFEVRGRWETPSYFFVYVANFFLSTCLRSKPLLARGQRALRAYNDIGEWLFVRARQPFANIVKLLCSFLCPLSLGAFALLLRSLVRECGGKVFRFPFLMALNGIRAAPLMTFNGSAVQFGLLNGRRIIF